MGCGNPARGGAPMEVLPPPLTPWQAAQRQRAITIAMQGDLLASWRGTKSEQRNKRKSDAQKPHGEPVAP